MSQLVPLKCSILRGGTSKGVFFRQEDLPADRSAIDPILLDVFGSPDIRQIDGLGGATSQTSKAAMIGPPSRDDADVDYTFAQVEIRSPLGERLAVALYWFVSGYGTRAWRPLLILSLIISVATPVMYFHGFGDVLAVPAVIDLLERQLERCRRGRAGRG
jgi:hypothetical protein